ncbi:ectoine/hydroxyectoine ABC transporter permease subunit EhuD [Sinorhizobium mexicanum]|uniref:Ectoine/hydroxyectoine ABC transporter permease subunit EhuD n=1 Tax=Sinorhizobium mexicanum TaxID=375549 RepID=A0A859QM19_9HYPH|nr:ectoine/hydroxyectoine ABC transporter permease subunit EhuD [Sinorhizobium mexicanum]MBP1885138.1 polar amino acid transport system permease protein [Sinorhizobium mexicanum]QLL64395.1 ectoine/hydroxyectoine ABC transporter permease subunit EhuD [Sinorhizobium mexicanum]
MTWDWTFVAEITPFLLQGLVVTVKVTLVASLFAMIVGLVFAIAKMSRNAFVRWLAIATSEGIRRTPLLIQLYLLFYVLPDLGFVLSPFVAGVIGLGLHYGTYISEVYRAGIINVPAGQWEAAKACNLTPRQTWTQIVLPQAIPPIIPPLGNYVIAMFKETPILSAITVLDVMGQALAQANYNYRYIEPITLVACAFLVVSLCSAAAIRALEYQLRR